jgi:hypothetical protein
MEPAPIPWENLKVVSKPSHSQTANSQTRACFWKAFSQKFLFCQRVKGLLIDFVCLSDRLRKTQSLNSNREVAFLDIVANFSGS